MMAMQYDVKHAHLNSSGFFTNFGTRIKGVSFAGTASTSLLVLFDTLTAPITASVTYAQSGTTVTVTKVAHGLVTGDVVGIHFDSNTGVSATDGTYSITRTGADTFTVTDINSRTITSTAAIYTVGRWLMTYESTAGDVYTNVPFIPGEGVRANTGIYAYMTNLESAQIFYG